MNLATNRIGERCSSLTQLESGAYDKYVSSRPSHQDIYPQLPLSSCGLLLSDLYITSTLTPFALTGLITARACNLAANCFVFGLIVWKTIQTMKVIRGSSISRLLFKQGALDLSSFPLWRVHDICAVLTGGLYFV
jgi:hypothetical protein